MRGEPGCAAKRVSRPSAVETRRRADFRARTIDAGAPDGGGHGTLFEVIRGRTVMRDARSARDEGDEGADEQSRLE
jgi:hypothetical protein